MATHLLLGDTPRTQAVGGFSRIWSMGGRVPGFGGEPMMFYQITRDGETVAKAATLADCYRFILDRCGYSVHNAITDQGWDILTPDGVSIRATGQY